MITLRVSTKILCSWWSNAAKTFRGPVTPEPGGRRAVIETIRKCRCRKSIPRSVGVSCNKIVGVRAVMTLHTHIWFVSEAPLKGDASCWLSFQQDQNLVIPKKAHHPREKGKCPVGASLRQVQAYMCINIYIYIDIHGYRPYYLGL